MALIGLGGAARAGKDAFADILVRDYGYTKMGMSDPLRVALETLDPVIPLDRPIRTRDGGSIGGRSTIRLRALLNLVDYSDAKAIPEVRRLLQVLGTDVVRNMIGEDSWVDAMTRRIQAASHMDAELGTDTRIVVTGIRFENELEMIEELGGRSVYVSRHVAMQSAPAHSSEISVLAGDFMHRIDNNGTLAGLEIHAKDFMRDLGVSPVSSQV